MSTRSGKYNAKRTTVDNIAFASQKEARRYQELKLLQKAGQIRELALQHPFALCAYANVAPGDAPIIGKYVADFVYEERANGDEWRLCVEDVKGVRTPLYRWKRKHFEKQTGLEIREV